MGLLPDYDIRINSDGYIIFQHPPDDNESYSFLKANIKPEAIVTVLDVSQGPDPEHSSVYGKQWVVKNYTGIKEIVQQFAELNGIRISKNVMKVIK